MRELFQKYKHILICLIVLTVYLLLLWYPLFDSNAKFKMYANYDFVCGFPQVIYFLDNLSLTKMTMAHWNQYVAAGTPTLLDFSNYYFPSYVLKFLYEIKNDFISLIDWQNFVFAHYIIAGLGMFLFVKRKVSGYLPALFASLFFVTSGLLHKLDWPMYIFAFTLIPWVFYLLELYDSKKKFHWLFLAAFLLFQQVVSCPQIFIYTILTLSGYILLLGGNDWWPKVKKLAFLYLLTVLYSAIFVLPLLEYTHFAVRQNYVSAEMVDVLSTKAADLFQLLVYAPSWQYTYLYIGGVSIFLIINLIVSQKKIESFKVLLLALIIFFLSTNTSLAASIMRIVPGLGDLKQHSRAIELVIFLLLMLVAGGLRYFQINFKRDIKILISLAALAVLIYFLRIERTAVNLEQLSFTLFFLGLAALTLYGFEIGVIKLKVATMLLGFIIIMDLARVHMLLEKTVLRNYSFDKLGHIIKDPFVYMAPPDTNDIGDTGYRFPYKYKDTFTGFDANAFIVKKQYSDGYYGSYGSTLTPYTLVGFDLYMKAADSNPNLKKLANINSGNGYLPRAFTTQCYKIETDDLKLLDLIADSRFTGDSFVYLSEKPKETMALELQVDEKCPSILQPVVTNQQMDKIIFAPINRDKESVLFISDNWYPGWNAYVNGKKTEIIRANYTFKAVPLSSGTNNVEFRYEPKSIKIGGLITIFSIFGSVLFLLIGPIRKKFSSKSRGLNA